MRTSGFMPGGGIDEGKVICCPFSYVQRLAETVRQLGPPTLKEGSAWLTRAACIAPSHANGPEGKGGATRAVAITTVYLAGHKVWLMKKMRRRKGMEIVLVVERWGDKGGGCPSQHTGDGTSSKY